MSKLVKAVEKKFMPMHMDAGTATDPDTGEVAYELCTPLTGGMLVQHVPTGNWFVMDWQDCIAAAEKAGITEVLDENLTEIEP